MNSKLVRDALVSLDGSVFATKEAVEDAVFPLYGPLQPLFQGEGHRDLVDRLERARWLTFVKGKGWMLDLPPIEKYNNVVPEMEQPVAATAQPTSKPSEAINAILDGNYKEAIRILTALL